jgi:hypothetical protein
MATVHNRERGRLVLLALFVVSYHPFTVIPLSQTKQRKPLSILDAYFLISGPGRLRHYKFGPKKIQMEQLRYAEFNYTLPEKIPFISIF